jgi:hypothetical protein
MELSLEKPGSKGQKNVKQPHLSEGPPNSWPPWIDVWELARVLLRSGHVFNTLYNKTWMYPHPSVLNS